jgi:hypothetical protein
VEGISSHAACILEMTPERRPHSEINLIENITTLNKHLNQASDLTKQNWKPPCAFEGADRTSCAVAVRRWLRIESL